MAANSVHWGLSPLREKIVKTSADGETTEESYRVTNLPLVGIIENLQQINNDITDCVLCGLPLQNEILIQDGGLWVFKCGHTFHGACLDLNKVKLCPSCPNV